METDKPSKLNSLSYLPGPFVLGTAQKLALRNIREDKTTVLQEGNETNWRSCHKLHE